MCTVYSTPEYFPDALRVSVAMCEAVRGEEGRWMHGNWTCFDSLSSRYRCTCSVSLFSREIGTFHRGGVIAIFIDMIWPSTVKPGPFPVRNHRTDFEQSPGHVLPPFFLFLPLPGSLCPLFCMFVRRMLRKLWDIFDTASIVNETMKNLM